MSANSLVRLLCLLAAAACLTVGYVLIGDWLILLAIPAMLALWITTGKRSAFWATCALLAVYVALAAMGMARHAPSLLMAAGCIFAVAGWDLSDPRGAPTGRTGPYYRDPLQKRRLQSLAVTAGASALLIAVPTVLRLRLPFGVIVLLSLALMGCVLYTVSYLGGSASRQH